MALIKAVPGLPNPYDFFPSPIVDNITAIAGKIFRVAIIVMQSRGRLGPAPVNGENPNFKQRKEIRNKVNDPSSVQLVNGENQKAEYRKDIRKKQGGIDLGDYWENQKPYKVTAKESDNPFKGDKIMIVDLGTESISNSKSYDYIELPFIPYKVSKQPESKFMGVATIGRNLPFYHFTGAEDNLEFEIDWFSDTYDREDVIFNCRWLEALTMPDGYGLPHRVAIVWGKDDKLFRGETWLLTSAAYELEQFVRGYREPNPDPTIKKYISTSLLPQQARQTVHFRKVSSMNRTYADVMGKGIQKRTIQTRKLTSELPIGSSF